MRKIYTRKKYRVKGGERPGRGTGIGRDLRKAAVEAVEREAAERERREAAERERLSVINEEGSERQSRATSQLPLTYMHPTRPSYMQPTRQPRGTGRTERKGRTGRTGRTGQTRLTTRTRYKPKECPICLNKMVIEMKNIITLKCGHRFHKHCICNWKKIGKKTCPSCRSDNLHYIKCG